MAVSIQVSDGVEVSCAILGDPVLSSSYLLTNHDVSILIFSIELCSILTRFRLLKHSLIHANSVCTWIFVDSKDSERDELRNESKVVTHKAASTPDATAEVL